MSYYDDFFSEISEADKAGFLQVLKDILTDRTSMLKNLQRELLNMYHRNKMDDFNQLLNTDNLPILYLMSSIIFGSIGLLLLMLIPEVCIRLKYISPGISSIIPPTITIENEVTIICLTFISLEWIKLWFDYRCESTHQAYYNGLVIYTALKDLELSDEEEVRLIETNFPELKSILIDILNYNAILYDDDDDWDDSLYN